MIEKRRRMNRDNLGVIEARFHNQMFHRQPWWHQRTCLIVNFLVLECRFGPPLFDLLSDAQK